MKKIFLSITLLLCCGTHVRGMEISKENETDFPRQLYFGKNWKKGLQNVLKNYCAMLDLLTNKNYKKRVDTTEKITEFIDCYKRTTKQIEGKIGELQNEENPDEKNLDLVKFLNAISIKFNEKTNSVEITVKK